MEEYALLFDSDRCVSCKRCITACREEHKIDGDWDRIFLTMRPSGLDFGEMEPFVQMCNHCDKPSCIESCPVEGKAIHKREKDGIVLVDKEKCTGCGKCIKGCPYDMIRLSNKKNSSGKTVVDKCTYCAHLIDELNGELPENFETPCVNICPVGALLFDKRSEHVKQVAWRGRENDVIDMKKEGLTPSNIYLKKRHIKNTISF